MQQPPIESSATAALKRAAMRLFAERGTDGVTVREIARAAGQLNHGAVSYHFGGKDALIRAIVIDGARIIDQRRNARLDLIEAAGGPFTLTEVIDTIVYPSLAVFGPDEEECYLRFIAVLGMTRRALFDEAVGEQWNGGYQRCLAHLRRLMPPMPAAQANQRLVFVGAYIAQILALRQTRLSDTSRAHATWPGESTLRHLTHTAAAMLEAPGFTTAGAGE